MIPYKSIPTMAQAMDNRMGTAAHAKQPKSEPAVTGGFDALLSIAGDEDPSGSSSGGHGAISGLWGTLISHYLKTGLPREHAGSVPEILRSAESGGAPASGDMGVLPAAGCTAGEGRLHDEWRGASAAHSALDATAGLGSLSAGFESGSGGGGASGDDPGGGTSYGIYQIASRPGTMGRFIDFLDREAPAWAERLRAAGEADTGGTAGEMPRVWQAIAAEDSTELERLQHAFIAATHYRPAAQQMEAAGLRMTERSEALQEALWSTAVQHGPGGAVRIFRSALSQVGAGAADASIIEQVYALRAETADGHAPALASALRNRFRAEKRQVLGMLQG
mgnify:CR=1 FL=1